MEPNCCMTFEDLQSRRCGADLVGVQRSFKGVIVRVD